MKSAPRTIEPFNNAWHFHQGDVKNGQRPGLDDRSWHRVRLPHDWSIEQPFDEGDESLHHGGYLPGGVGWYRKRFRLPRATAGQRVRLSFDGVFMKARVWLNGHELGRHAYGYTPFSFDLTPHLAPAGKDNLLAVRVDNSLRPNSRWYSGSGIYRPVTLTCHGDLHVAHEGIALHVSQAGTRRARVEITVEIDNAGEAVKGALRCSLFDPDGVSVTSTDTRIDVASGAGARASARLTVANPRLWHVDHPWLYRLEVTVLRGGAVVDQVALPVGLRTARFDARRGFLLNGTPLTLKGVNVHHDNGCLGAAAWPRAEERRVELMKSIGANAIRTSHNPPSASFLDACDRLGILVMDEAFDEWQRGKLKHGYKDLFRDHWREDLEAMVRRDRNHPSVILWSIGNEIPEQGTKRGVRTAARLAGYVRELDPTRPVTCAAMPSHWPSPEFWQALDVCGYNYRDEIYAADGERFPGRIILGTETMPPAAWRTWHNVLENAHAAGEFIWTGMDYLGESGIGHARAADNAWPTHMAVCGELDICGHKKPQSYYRDILWDNGTEVYMAVRRPLPNGEEYSVSPWGWPDSQHAWQEPRLDDGPWPWPGWHDKPLQVDVYTSCDDVELRLNGRGLGRRQLEPDARNLATWMVPWQPGKLEAIGRRAGRVVARDVLHTPREPAALKLTPDRCRLKSDGADLSFVTVEIIDKDGRLHPAANPPVRFALRGPGRILAVGNGDPRSLEPFQARQRRAWQGRCLVVIQAGSRTGCLELTARAAGLSPASCKIDSRGGRVKV